ncbi:MAG TPA: AAA family ATPase [Acidimicrobiales bacterium]|nr:AAA family ATPase [Acidimicrobiales bacterium]
MVRALFPLVVVVSGLPAAGKSTLSRRLASDLGLPCVSRDDIRRAVFVDHGAPLHFPVEFDVAAAVDRAVGLFVSSVLDANVGVVIDGNFNHRRHAEVVIAAIAHRDVRRAEICLWGDPYVLRARFVERAAPPLTAELEPYFDAVVNRERWTVLAQEPLASIDSTDVRSIDRQYDNILNALRSAR